MPTISSSPEHTKPPATFDTTQRSFEARPGAPVEWPIAYFRAIEAGLRPDDCPAVCIEHKGQHVWYLNSCSALPPQQPRHLNPRPHAPVVTARLTLDWDDLIDLGRARRARGATR